MRVAIFVIFALCFPTAWAQQSAELEPSCSQIVSEAHSVSLHGVAPVAGVEFRMTFVRRVLAPGETGELGSCRVFSFYRLIPSLPRDQSSAARTRELRALFEGREIAPLLVARHAVDAIPAMPPRWTSSDVCPSLTNVLAKLEALLAPNLSGPHLVHLNGVSEQGYFGAWANLPMNTPFRDDWYKLLVAVGDDTALSQWFNETSDALESCWSYDPPNAPAPLKPVDH